MAYAYVQTAQNSVTASGATTVATGNFGANPTTGNFIIAGAFYDGNGTTSLTGLTITLTDTLGNTYTPLKTVDDTTNGYRLALFYAKNITGGGANSVTATYGTPPSSNFYKGVFAAEYSGLDTSAPFTSGEVAGQEQNSVGTGTDAISSGNTPALSTQPCLVVGFTSIAHSTAGPSSSGTGYTSRGSFWQFGTGTNFATLEDKRVTSTSAVAATFTAPSSGSSYMTIVGVFKEAVINNFTLSVTNGTYTMTGEPTTLVGGSFLTASNGSYSLSGQVVNFSLNSGSFVLPATAGMYSLLGGLSYADIQVDLAAGTYSFLGEPVNFSTGVNGFVVNAQNGTYTIVGKSANIIGPPVSGAGHFLGLLGVGN